MLNEKYKMAYSNAFSFKIFVFIFSFSFFFPNFPEHLGSSGAILINAFIIFVCGLFFIHLFFSKALFDEYVAGVVYKQFSILILVFLPLIVISMFVGVIVYSVDVQVRDFFEFHRPVMYFFIFTLAYFCMFNRRNIENFPKVLDLFFLMIVVFSLIQFFKLEVSFSELYTKANNVKTLRLASPFVNPYDFAFIMSFFFFFYLLRSLTVGIAFLLPTVLCLILIFLSQSRSVSIALFLSVVFFVSSFMLLFGVRFYQSKIKKGFLMYLIFIAIFLVSLVLSLSFIQENFRYMSSAFEKLAAGEQINSANVRKEQWLYAIERAQEPLVFIFGNGPAKSEMEYLETIYAYLLFRYGVLGFSFYFLTLFLGCYFIFDVMRRNPMGSEMFPLYGAIFIWFVTIPLFSIGNNLTEQVRSSFFYYSLLGISAAVYVRNKRESA